MNKICKWIVAYVIAKAMVLGYILQALLSN